jgi:hypothetical protein
MPPTTPLCVCVCVCVCVCIVLFSVLKLTKSKLFALSLCNLKINKLVLHILCVCVCSLRYPACNAHAPYWYLRPAHIISLTAIFSQKSEHKTCFNFFYNFCPTYYHSENNAARYDQNCILFFNQGTRYYCQIFSSYFRNFIKYQISWNPSRSSWVVPCGRTDLHNEANNWFYQFRERA